MRRKCARHCFCVSTGLNHAQFSALDKFLLPWWWYSFLHRFLVGYCRISDREEESLLNKDVYSEPDPWDDDEKVCVCPYTDENNHVSLCSANEDDTCTYQRYYWGRRIEPRSGVRRGVLKRRVNRAVLDKQLAKMVELSRAERRMAAKFGSLRFKVSKTHKDWGHARGQLNCNICYP